MVEQLKTPSTDINDELREIDISHVPLTKWAKEPTLRELKQDLDDAKQAHDSQVLQVQEWLDARNVTGKHKPQPSKTNSSVQPALIRKQNEWRYASLSEPFLADGDLFLVKPTTWEDVPATKQNQLVLNHQFNNVLDRVKFIDEYVRTAVDEGTVIVRTGWDFHEKEVEVEVPIVEFFVDPSVGPQLEQLMQLQEQSPSEFQAIEPAWQQALQLSIEQQQPLRPQITGMRMEKQLKTVRNQPTLEICDYRNVIADPTCNGDLDKAQFIVYRFETSLAALQADGRYQNLDNINPETTSILAEPDHASEYPKHGFNFQDKARKKFVVHEYWGYRDVDGSGRLTPFVAAWVGNTMIRMEENPFPDQKLPFVAAQYLPVRKNTYGEPDAALLEDNQRIIGAVTRGMIDILGKSANGQTGIRKDMLDVTNRRKFEKGLDYEFNAQVDPRQGIFMHTYPEIPVSAQWLLQQQSMDAESLTGVKAFNNGISGQALGETATGVRGALDAASKRELGILRRLTAGIVAIGQKIISMNAEFLGEEEVVRVTNDEFVTVRRDELAGKFDLRLTISTPEERNAQAQDLAFLTQTMGPNADPGISKLMYAEIARLKKMPDFAKRIEEFEPQPDPMQQKIQQLQAMKLEWEIKLLQSQVMENQAGAQLDMAKAGTEQVKAGKTAAERDKLNLDFVEQESGVTQERELQKHGEQARSQMQLKVLDRQFDLQDQRREDFKEYLQNSKD